MRRALALVLALCSTAQAQPRWDLRGAPKPGPVKPEIHGVARLRYARDQAAGLDGHQTSQYLNVTAANVFSEKLSFTFDARNRLEWQRTEYGATRRESFDSYLAFVQLQRLYGGTSLKAGRQYFFSGQATAHFDGGAAEWQPARWFQLSGFAGRPVAVLGYAPAAEYRGGGLRLGAGRQGYLQLNLLLADHREFRTDRDAQVTVFRRIVDGLDFTGNVATLNSKPSSANARLNVFVAPASLTVTPHYYRHMLTGDPASVALSPYARPLVVEQGFERMGMGFSKYLQAGLSLSGGGSVTRPSDRREAYLSAAATNIAKSGFDALVFVNYNSQLSRRNVSVTASAGYAAAASLRLSAGGTMNQQSDRAYGLDRNAVTRTYFGEVKWTPAKGREVTVSPSAVRAPGVDAPIYRLEVSNGWRF